MVRTLAYRLQGQGSLIYQSECRLRKRQSDRHSEQRIEVYNGSKAGIFRLATNSSSSKKRYLRPVKREPVFRQV